MLFRPPKPLHGWREFIHEIVIVVIGVLLALGGAQLIDALRARSDVASFRASVDQELGRNLGIYQHMMAARPCATRGLADLERFLADSQRGRRDRLLRPIGRPFAQTGFFSVWDNKDSAVIEHMPPELRLRYAELYDEFRNNETVHRDERDVWRGLSQFEQPEPLDHADRMRMRELLTRAEQFNEVTGPNYDYILKLADGLGIGPIGDSNIQPVASDNICQSLLAP